LQPAAERGETVGDLLLAEVLLTELVEAAQRAVEEESAGQLAEEVGEVIGVILHHLVLLLVVDHNLPQVRRVAV